MRSSTLPEHGAGRRSRAADVELEARATGDRIEVGSEVAVQALGLSRARSSWQRAFFLCDGVDTRRCGDSLPARLGLWRCLCVCCGCATPALSRERVRTKADTTAKPFGGKAFAQWAQLKPNDPLRAWKELPEAAGIPLRDTTLLWTLARLPEHTAFLGSLVTALGECSAFADRVRDGAEGHLGAERRQSLAIALRDQVAWALAAALRHLSSATASTTLRAQALLLQTLSSSLASNYVFAHQVHAQRGSQGRIDEGLADAQVAMQLAAGRVSLGACVSGFVMDMDLAIKPLPPFTVEDPRDWSRDRTRERYERKMTPEHVLKHMKAALDAALSQPSPTGHELALGVYALLKAREAARPRGLEYPRNDAVSVWAPLGLRMFRRDTWSEMQEIVPRQSDHAGHWYLRELRHWQQALRAIELGDDPGEHCDKVAGRLLVGAHLGLSYTEAAYSWYSETATGERIAPWKLREAVMQERAAACTPQASGDWPDFAKLRAS